MTTLQEELKKLLKHKQSKKYYAEKLNTSINVIEELLKELRQSKSNEAEAANYIAELENEIVKKVNNEKGTLESQIETSFEPRNDIELAQLHKIDLTKYKISTYWTKQKSNGKFTSSVLCSLKKPQDYSIEDFTNFLKEWKPVPIIIYRKSNNIHQQHLKEIVDIELNIADFHLAKKTDDNKTIEQKTFDYYNTISDLISKVKNNYTINKIVFPISNDFFHTDNYQNTTTNGTPQDVTMWYNEEYEKGFSLLANSISFLSTQCNTIEVILVQGNHDRTKSFFVAHALEIFFKDKPEITFQRHHSTTKATTLGNTFVGYHHGNCKLDELPLLFATGEYAKDFGNATYREIHTGDKHHYMAKEIKGVRIQQMPSLSGTDRWHYDNNFVHSIRAALVLVYHPTQGKICEFEHRI